MKRLLIALISVIAFISCKDENKKNTVEEVRSLSFSSKTIEKKLNDCIPENGDCTFISLTFPVAENGEGEAEKINKKIHNFMVNTIDYQDEEVVEDPEALATNFIEDYKETASEFSEYDLPWEATITGKVIYRSPSIISVKFDTDMFTGGAHGYRSTNYLNFNPANGTSLGINDLFNAEFSAFVEKDFRKKQSIEQGENINSTGMFFENDEFHLPTNIGITSSHIILHYNTYDIAPYSEGNFIMTYPKEEITQYLKMKDETPAGDELKSAVNSEQL